MWSLLSFDLCSSYSVFARYGEGSLAFFSFLIGANLALLLWMISSVLVKFLLSALSMLLNRSRYTDYCFSMPSIAFLCFLCLWTTFDVALSADFLFLKCRGDNSGTRSNCCSTFSFINWSGFLGATASSFVMFTIYLYFRCSLLVWKLLTDCGSVLSPFI